MKFNLFFVFLGLAALSRWIVVISTMKYLPTILLPSVFVLSVLLFSFSLINVKI